MERVDLRQPRLTSLSGLEALRVVGRDVNIVDQAALTSLSGLGALTSVGEDLSVNDNPALCDEDVDTLVAQLVGFVGTVTRYGNEGVCPE